MASIARRSVLAGSALALTFSGQAQAAKVGQVAPPFSILTFDFKKVTSPELRGQVIVLNFWATWCAPCRKELPELSAYFQKYAGQGLKMFAVKDGDERPNQDLVPLSKALNFPLVWHLTGRGYGAIGDAFPSNYVIDRAGILRYAQAGAFDAQSLEEIVTPLLKEPGPPDVA